MLLCMSGAFGQTAQKLIAKYKALPNAEYKENTEEVRRNIEENKKKELLKDIENINQTAPILWTKSFITVEDMKLSKYFKKSIR